MSDVTLAYVSATEALARFRSGTLSPVELLDAVLARAEAVNPTVNAFTATYVDEARAQARVAEQRYREGTARPLEGIPVAIKDEAMWAGRRVTQGSLIYRDYVADVSEPMVQRILDAGGIAHAQTTTPEFCVAGFTWSRLWGVTRNPWSPDFTPGGSSGGSGAALAAGMTTLATGSDIGGSIRIPAAFCGVVGYKPPYGRVPVMPPFGLDDFCHNGPMGRSVADVALLQDVIAGPHPIDVASVAPTPTLGTPSADVRGWRIGYSVGLGDYVVADDVQRSLLAVVDVFRSAGATVDEIDIDVRRADVRDAASIHFGAIFGSSVGAEIEEHGDVMCEYTKSFAESTTQAAADRGLLAGLEIEDRVWRPIASAVYGYDVVLVPTLAATGIAADQDYYADPIVIDGNPLADPFDAFMTTAFNIASRCPVLVVPGPRARNGVPVGIQIVARPYEDHRVFEAGAAFEQHRPGAPEWPRYDSSAHLPLAP